VDNLLASLRKIAKEERAAGDAPGVAPLSAADRDEIAAALLTVGRAAPSPLASLEGRLAENGPSRPVAAGALGHAAPRRPSWALAPRRWAVVALPVAAAAAFFMVWGRTPRGGGGDLPAYDLSVEGGAKEVRGGGPVRDLSALATTAPVQRVVQGTELVLVARPADPVAGAVGVRVFVVDEAGAKEIDARTRISPSGSVEIRVAPWSALAEAAAPSAASGTASEAVARRSSLRAVVGRPDELRTLSLRDVASAPADTAALRWLTVPLDVIGR